MRTILEALVMPHSIHGVMTWNGFTLPLALPTREWVTRLEAFTGLPFVPTPDANPSPILEVLDERTTAVDGVAWAPFATHEDLEAWLYLTVSDVMVMRGELAVLHAAAFCHNGAVRLLCGSEWAGKSTMAIAALEAGYELLGDDQVLPVVEEERVYALPRPIKRRVIPGEAAPPIDSVRAKLGEEPVTLLPRAGGRFARCDIGYPIANVVHLRRHSGPGVRIRSLGGFERQKAALDQVRAYSLRHPLADAARLARWLRRQSTHEVSVGDYETLAALEQIAALPAEA